jgi:hypothetical protein
MTYRRAALTEAGGFDERFPRAYREDADLALRVRDHGRDERTDPTACGRPLAARTVAPVAGDIGADAQAAHAAEGERARICGTLPDEFRGFLIVTLRNGMITLCDDHHTGS